MAEPMNLVPIRALRWYRFKRYSGTDSSATVVPIRRYYQLIRFVPLLTVQGYLISLIEKISVAD